jgi:hypothetical protein
VLLLTKMYQIIARLDMLLQLLELLKQWRLSLKITRCFKNILLRTSLIVFSDHFHLVLVVNMTLIELKWQLQISIEIQELC